MEWTRGRTIGRGSSAAVSAATDLRSGETLAVKSVEFTHLDFLKREQRILSQLNCPQVIAYKGFDVTLENGNLICNLLMEFASRGSILDDMERAGGQLDEETAQFYTREILTGLEYVHSSGVVHCDIKCCNILIGEDGIKIADFGCAQRVEEVSGGNLAGTPMFMAPEVARGEKQGFEADVWAVGCMVIQMVTGRAPWADLSDPVAAIYRIGSGDDLPEIPRFMSEQGKDFLRRCLVRNPDERWTISELLKHPFVQEQNSRPKQNSRTPTSILEHGLWNWMNDFETVQSSNRVQIYRTPLQRIQQLSEVSKFLSFEIPNWESNEDWITVRSKETLDLELLCFSESMAMATENESISRKSDYCSKKKDLFMSSVSNQIVILNIIDFSNKDKLCIVISLFLVFSSGSLVYLMFLRYNENVLIYQISTKLSTKSAMDVKFIFNLVKEISWCIIITLMIHAYTA